MGGLEILAQAIFLSSRLTSRAQWCAISVSESETIFNGFVKDVSLGHLLLYT